MSGDDRLHVVILGGGFGGVGCARELAKHDDVRVSLVDRNNYHQFQPLLYQVATSQLAPSDIAYSLRKLFLDDQDVDVVLGEVDSVDLAGHAVTTTEGLRVEGDVLVLAAGSQPNFFRTEGRGGARVPAVLAGRRGRAALAHPRGLRGGRQRPRAARPGRAELRDRRRRARPAWSSPARSADLIHETMTAEYHHLAVTAAQVHLVDLGTSLLAPFSDSAHGYASKVLERKGVRLHLGVAVTEIGPGHVTLADGTTIPTRCVVWGGGIMAPGATAGDGLPHGRGGRVDVQPDLSVEGLPGVYVVGDAANIPGPDGSSLPQLGSVALQSGAWAADNIRAVAAGKQAKPFHYHDKGIMAMIGRGAAIAEVGAHRHELHGVVAFSAWLGVHSALMLGVRNRIDAFVAWGWDNFSSSRGPQVLDRADAAQIDWDEDRAPSPSP